MRFQNISSTITLPWLFLNAIGHIDHNVINNPWIQSYTVLIMSSIINFWVKFIISQYLYFRPNVSPIISITLWSHVYRLLLGLYFASSHACPFYLYFEYMKVLESTVSWLPGKSYHLQAGYESGYFPQNKFKIWLREVFQNSIL